MVGAKGGGVDLSWGQLMQDRNFTHGKYQAAITVRDPVNLYGSKRTKTYPKIMLNEISVTL